MKFEYSIKTIPEITQKTDVKVIIQKIKHMLPEYIFDAAQVENNPITIPEIKTLIDGITIGGHKISDVQQILNLNNSWKYIIESLKQGTFETTFNYSNRLHEYLGREEALEWGCFRNGSIEIAGTLFYKCPESNKLKDIYDDEVKWVMSSANQVENALRYFLWGCLNQFYWDCNKRISRLMSIGILVSNGYGILNTPAKYVPEFNKLMTEFYDTHDANNMIDFLCNTSLKQIRRQQ